MYDREKKKSRNYYMLAVWSSLAVVFLIGACFLLIAGGKSFARYQKRADARNQVEVNRIRIEQTEQLVEIERQQAQVKIAEAEGIAEAQRIIDESLTPEYLTYFAIQAQMKMADSPNHTTVYIPVGNNGIPFVQNLTPDTAGE